MTTLPAFDLHRPATLEAATDLLDRYGADAAPICGGTELLLLLKLGFGAFGQLVEIRGIEELRRLDAVDGMLEIGAAVSHREIERSPLVQRLVPALAALERGVANLRVRNAGTLGGNLCFSDPHSDPATFLLAAGGEVVLRRGGEQARTLPVSEFVVGPYQTALREGELMTAVRLPATPAGTALVHRKIAFRERPAATLTCLASVAAGRVVEARVAVGSVGPIAVRAPEAERLLVGLDAAAPDPGVLAAAGEAAAAACGAVDDANGSADYKRHLVGVLLRRAFPEAAARAAA